MARQQTRIEGIEDFQRELRRLDAKWETDFLEIANKKVANLIADDARPAFARLGGVPGARTAATVKAASAKRAATVKIGGAKAPFALGVEFGGGLHGRGNPTSRGGYTTQFRPHRGSGEGAGYALWPTIRKNRKQILDTYDEFLEKVARPAFPE